MQEKNQKIVKKVVVLGLGGTIAGLANQANDNVNYQAGQVSVADLLGGLGLGFVQILKNNAIELSTEQIAQLDSKDMSFAVWQQLLQRLDFYLQQDDVAGLVITHGTDTLEETAYFLHRTIKATKPIVLTCAMRPASALNPDGPQNLRDAIMLAQQSDLLAVVVACDGVVHSAQDVQKDHPYRTAAFSSRDNGVLGWIEEGHLRQVRVLPSQMKRPFNAIQKLLNKEVATLWPQVEIVLNYAGCDGAVVNALVAHHHQLAGLVVAGTGNGTLSKDLIAQLNAARQKGILVWGCSRCAYGQVVGHTSEGIDAVIELSYAKARVELMLQLLNE
jgi:L-asparaginase